MDHWRPPDPSKAHTYSFRDPATMRAPWPGWVIVTDDCRRECEELEAKGVTIVDPPVEMPWGMSALVADLYGNVHNLLEPHTPE